VSHYFSYLNSAEKILLLYNGNEPFNFFIKNYFKQHKKHGSKDRKQISHLCYCYFRLGPGLAENIKYPQKGLQERILKGLFLCSTLPGEILGELKPAWNEKVNLPVCEKLIIVNQELSSVFPWKSELSKDIKFENFAESFFIQPDLFLRLRPGQEAAVKQKLKQAGIKFNVITADCLSLINASKIDAVIDLDKEAVIQDYNSQKTGTFLKDILTSNVQPSVWDCCAASGGKSLMAYDFIPNISLTVSDIRKSILVNLEKRFEKAGITRYHSFIADLTDPQFKISNVSFDIIICDAPCSGSGTWSRTPEQLHFFNENKILHYAALQKKIVSNAIPHLKPGGYFLYITCSVFKNENEDVAIFIQQRFHLELIKMELLKGYDKKADNMFVALFRKNA
jgi:16S rRNA (cytosine967-C5)-methyltransferase